MGHRVRMGIGEIAVSRAFNRKGRKVCAKNAKKTSQARPFLANFAKPLRTLRLRGLGVLLMIAAVPISAAQSTHTTVRHHKVEDQDPAAAFLNEAESDIGKQNYSAAEPLLKKYL